MNFLFFLRRGHVHYFYFIPSSPPKRGRAINEYMSMMMMMLSQISGIILRKKILMTMKNLRGGKSFMTIHNNLKPKQQQQQQQTPVLLLQLSKQKPHHHHHQRFIPSQHHHHHTMIIYTNSITRHINNRRPLMSLSSSHFSSSSSSSYSIRSYTTASSSSSSLLLLLKQQDIINDHNHHSPYWNRTMVRYMRNANKHGRGSNNTNTGQSSSSSSSSSSKKQNTNTKKRQTRSTFNLDALPFSISPEQALHSFRHWAEEDQGLRWLLSYDSVRIGAAYVPVWSFDLNIRFSDSNNKYWKPPMFATIYGGNNSNNQSTIYLPGLSSYAGYSYRRSLIHPVHSTTLVFMGDQTQKFGSWMLKDMILQDTGLKISVIPDAWNATEGRSFSFIKEELQDLIDDSWPYGGGQNETTPKVQTEVVKSRRVYMPTFVIDYKILGLQYRAFVSGCDEAAPIAGVSHQMFGPDNMFSHPEFHSSASRDFMSTVATTTSRVARDPRLFPFVFSLIRPIFSAIGFVLLRIWAKIPILGFAGGLFAGFRKIIQPYWDSRQASAEWERQRDHEAQASETNDATLYQKADFHDHNQTAYNFFMRNKTQILRGLSGDQTHTQGQYDWYKDWEQWAKQQWAQQQQQQQQQQYGRQQQQQQQQQQQTYQQQQQTYQQQKKKKKKETEYHWDFDENDPYSVLGISRTATPEEISQAFRTQMLKHHPDTQPNATEAQKQRAVERSKIITNAYRTLKQLNKKKK